MPRSSSEMILSVTTSKTLPPIAFETTAVERGGSGMSPAWRGGRGWNRPWGQDGAGVARGRIGICIGLAVHFGTSAFGVGAPKSERPSSLNGRDPALGAKPTSRERTVKGRVGSEATPNSERRDPSCCCQPQMTLHPSALLTWHSCPRVLQLFLRQRGRLALPGPTEFISADRPFDQSLPHSGQNLIADRLANRRGDP